MTRTRTTLLLAVLFAATAAFLAAPARDAYERYARGGRFVYVLTVGLPGRTNRTFKTREIEYRDATHFRFHDADSGRTFRVPRQATIVEEVPQR